MRLGPGDPMEVRGLLLFSGMPPISFLSTNGIVDMTQRLSQKTIQLEEINIWQGWLPEGADILR